MAPDREVYDLRGKNGASMRAQARGGPQHCRGRTKFREWHALAKHASSGPTRQLAGNDYSGAIEAIWQRIAHAIRARLCSRVEFRSLARSASVIDRSL